MNKKLFIPMLLFSTYAFTQVGINTSSPNATLDVNAKATDGSLADGFIPPRLTGDALREANLNNIYGADQNGAIVFVTTPAAAANQIEQTVHVTEAGMYYFDSEMGVWMRLAMGGAGRASFSSFDCSSAVNIGILHPGTEASNVYTSVPYTGGNGGMYIEQSIPSTGVTGLTATLPAGNLAIGDGSVDYIISGTPSGNGTASFAISLAGRNCTFTRTVSSPATVGSLLCSSVTQNKALISTDANSAGITVTLGYTGANGGSYEGMSIPSTNVEGLIATLEPGNLANGNGSLIFNISGTAQNDGIATFDVTIGGLSCKINVTVGCGAYVAAGVWQSFMCHNLGADTSADPLLPSAAIHGAKYQWGAKTGETGRYYSQIDDQLNNGTISGWNQTALPNDTWRNDSKTQNDPCPTGYRVPTHTNWSGVISNNGTPTVLGTWTNSPSNYGAAIRYGSLVLPIAGFRMYNDGAMTSRGASGYYWSSNFLGNNFSNSLAIITSSNIALRSDYKTLGHSVRCISFGEIITLDCSSATNSGRLISSTPASNVSTTLSYSGGNGGVYAGQTVSSTGVTGLTATLASGKLASGNGTVTYTISGTPSGSGTASFMITLAGKSCTITHQVLPAASLGNLICTSARNSKPYVEKINLSQV